MMYASARQRWFRGAGCSVRARSCLTAVVGYLPVGECVSVRQRALLPCCEVERRGRGKCASVLCRVGVCVLLPLPDLEVVSCR